MLTLKFFTFLAVAITAFATPTLAHSQCEGKETLCCDGIASYGSTDAASFSGAIPANLQSPNMPLGVHCVPVGVLRLASSSSCTKTTACCSSLYNDGPVPFGVDCAPVDASL